MVRAATMRSLWVVFCGAGLAFGQDSPPLEGPVSQPGPPQAGAPAAPRPTAPQATAPARRPVAGPSPLGPTLAIPGVTVPAARSGAANRPYVPQPSRPSASSTPAAGATPLSLEGPSILGSPFRPADRPRGQDVPSSASDEPIPLTLEPLDDEPAPAQNRPGSRSPRETPHRPPGSTSTEEPDSTPANPRPAPWRMPGFLGRVLGQPPASSSRNAARSSEAAGRAKTKSEPDTDAVVQRRIEKQIRSTLGDKVQSVQVRVDGRNVLIVARPTRFWQKRGVQRALESLPALTGFRARIDLGN